MKRDRLMVGTSLMLVIAMGGAFFGVSPSPYIAGALVLLFMGYAS